MTRLLKECVLKLSHEDIQEGDVAVFPDLLGKVEEVSGLHLVYVELAELLIVRLIFLIIAVETATRHWILLVEVLRPDKGEWEVTEVKRYDKTDSETDSFFKPSISKAVVNFFSANGT